MAEPQSEVQYGTLDLMVLKTLDSMGPLHGYGIARRIEQAAQGLAGVEPGDDLSGSCPAGDQRLDQQRLGYQRKQPARTLLRPHSVGKKAVGGRNGKLVPQSLLMPPFVC